MNLHHTTILAAAVALATLSGCAGASRSGSGSANASKESYIEQYSSGQYTQAYDNAVEAAGQLRGPKYDQAALTAGLSAHALGRNAEAVRWLSPLEKNPDVGVAGKAGATLGLIAQERGEHETAVKLLTRASSKLTGDEAARASMYAGDSMAALGKAEDAKKAYAQAEKKLATDGNLKLMVADRMRGNIPPAGKTGASFATGSTDGATSQKPRTTSGASVSGSSIAPQSLTVQTGAYKDRKKAETEARQIANSKGVAARVVPILKDGQMLYAVRVGSFSNRTAAENIRRNVGGKAVVTVASGE